MKSLFDPAEQLQITCNAPDEFQQKIVGWDIDHLQLAPGNYWVNVNMVHTQNIQFSNITHNVGVHERGCVSAKACAISLPTLLGTEPLYFCGGILEKDECPISMSGEGFETLSSGGMNYNTIVIDIGLLNREAVRLTGHPFSSLIRSQRVCIQKQNQLRLAQSISTIIQELKNYPHHLPTVQQQLLEKQIMEQLLLSIRPPSGEKIKIPNRRQVAWKAEQFIRQKPQQQLTIDQLCNLIGCSSRTLHLGFKERYGMTPGQYGHILALNIVRHKLCHLHPRESVSEIAMACGFFHLGRFSQQYKQLFAELPSVTIKRTRNYLR